MSYEIPKEVEEHLAYLRQQMKDRGVWDLPHVGILFAMGSLEVQQLKKENAKLSEECRRLVARCHEKEHEASQLRRIVDEYLDRIDKADALAAARQKVMEI